jgi:hypothetical protein
MREVGADRLRQAPVKSPWLLAALVAAPRLLVFPFNENLHGDAIARTWLAHYWLEAPHVIGGFDQGGFQFGPLHLYLLALAEWAWPSLLHAGRVVSLLAGVATALPLHALTRRLFGVDAAVLAVAAFAAWGLHIQCSTTAAGEALNLLLVVAAVERFSAWLEVPRSPPRDALAAALLLNLACATRYDSWLLVPLLVLVAWRERGLGAATWFGAASSAFAAAWLFGNFVDRGNPLYPFGYIDDFHRAWFPAEEATWGRLRYRLICLFFWPGAALLTLTPLVGVPAMVGLVRAWQARRARWLVLIIVTPALLYTFRAVALASFAPLARFTVKELVLALPFTWLGLSPLLGRLGAWRGRALGLGAVACFGWTAFLGWFCVDGEGPAQRSLRPIAPTSRIEARHRVVAQWLQARAGGPGSVVFDTDPRGYDDMVLGYHSGFAYERQVRRRSVLFERRLGSGPVGLLVRFEGGQLEREGRLELSPGRAVLDGVAFEEVAGFAPPIHVYQAASAR